ncbi:MAG: hypothetical protein Q4F80_06715, partial [bacterium]|nr:hypothetical protein [bacterium]
KEKNILSNLTAKIAKWLLREAEKGLYPKKFFKLYTFVTKIIHVEIIQSISFLYTCKGKNNTVVIKE